jgi:Pin2-interacting protein X1
LGIAPTPSTTSGSSTPSGKLTSPGEAPTLEKLTTSTKSVADYFRDKLRARSSAKSGTTTPATPRTEYEAEAHEAPRGGLGSSRHNLETPKLLSSSLPTLNAPTHQSASQKLAVDNPSAETSTSEDISFTEPSQSTTKKKRTKEKDPCLNDLAVPSDEVSVEGTREAKKRAKSDKKARKEKKRS